MPRKIRSVFQRPHTGGVGPKSWATSVGKGTNAWSSTKKPRTGRKKRGW